MCRCPYARHATHLRNLWLSLSLWPGLADHSRSPALKGSPPSQPTMNGNAGEANHDPPQPDNPGIPNQWHEDVTQDRREELVLELVQAIFPVPDPAALRDRRMENLLAYARKVEGDIYESANSREEYERLLREQVNRIREELEEKRRTRLQRLNMPPNAAAPGPGVPGPAAGA